MKNDQTTWIRIVLSTIVLLFAVFRFVFFEAVSERMDSTFLLLLALAVLIAFLPWERLKHLKAGGIELSLDRPQVKGAIDSLGLDRVENKQLQEMLSRNVLEIQQLNGSRILWIDDKPHNIIGERRLLRALGGEVDTATSSEMAEEILVRDNDFDMIVSDVQRKGESYKLNNGIPIHEGVNFIVKLRKHGDPIIKSIPVTFYAAYDWDRLVKFTRPARETYPEPEISNSIMGLLAKVIKVLSEVRSNPIKVGLEKKPTEI